MVTRWTMTIDTEEEWEWGKSWPATNLSLRNVQKLPAFQDLCDRHDAATTYFVAWSVLNDPSAREVVLDLAQRPQVETGMHVHPWCTPPLNRPEVIPVCRTYLHNYPEEQIRAKLKTAYEKFREHELRPVTYRGGRFSSCGVIQGFLREKQFIADSSAVPFTRMREPGAPDYRRRDLMPRRLSPRKVDEGPLWELPVTRGFTRGPAGLWRRFYQWVEGSWARNLRLIGICERLGIVQRIWLNFEMVSADQMLRLLSALRPQRLPFICFIVHSSSLMAGGNPYVKTEEQVQQLLKNVDRVFSTINQWPDFQSATVAEVAHQLEEERNASIGN